MPDSLEFIFNRRSIRKFTDQPIPEVELTRLLQAAMAAPSAMNAQPWEFVVVTDPAVLKELYTSTLFSRHKAAAVIAVCGRSRTEKTRSDGQFWVQDCSAASENILLAATALGLGSVWVGVYPVTLFTTRVSQILNLPKNVIPLGMVYLGYPAEKKEPRTQYDETRVHWQTFEPRSKRGNGKTAPGKFSSIIRSILSGTRKKDELSEEKKEA